MKKLFYLLFAFILFSCSEEECCLPTLELVTNEITNITDVSARVSGVIMNPTCDEAATSQGFVFATATRPKLNDNVIEKSGSDISATLLNLGQHKTYYLRTFFESKAGIYYGNEVEFTTEVGDALIILNDFTQITANSVIANIGKNSTGGGNITDIGVCYATTAYPTIHKNVISCNSNKSMKIEGLANYTLYYARAFAINEAGIYYSQQKSFITH